MDTSYVRKELTRLLRSGGAHASFDDIVSGFPPTLLGLRPAGVPHTAWQLMEHLRIAQWDIVEFTRNPNHVSPTFPSGYWPETSAPPDDRAWDASVVAFKKDLLTMQQLVKDVADIFEPLAHSPGETIFSRMLLLADHNSYHYGQLMSLRRSLEKWVEFLPVRPRDP